MAGSVQEAFRKTLEISEERPNPHTVWSFFKQKVEETERRKEYEILKRGFEDVGAKWYERRFKSDYVAGEEPDLADISEDFHKLIEKIGKYNPSQQIDLFSGFARAMRIFEGYSDIEYPKWINEEYVQKFNSSWAKRNGREASVLSDASLNFVMAIGEIYGFKEKRRYDNLQTLVYATPDFNGEARVMKLPEVIHIVLSHIQQSDILK